MLSPTLEVDKVRNPVHQCYHKDAFETRRAAERGIDGLLMKGRIKNIATIRSYRCPHCYRWHIGHK